MGVRVLAVGGVKVCSGFAIGRVQSAGARKRFSDGV